MSKFSPLWEYVAACQRETLGLSFGDVEKIAGEKIDHSFLNYKKELLQYGYEVKKISMRPGVIYFQKLN